MPNNITYPRCGKKSTIFVEERCAFHHEWLTTGASSSAADSRQLSNPLQLNRSSPEVESALEMVSQGATKGMMRARLRQQGLRDNAIEQAIQIAISNSKLKARGKGAISIAAGLCLIAISILVFLRQLNNQMGFPVMPNSILGIGFVVTCRGLVSMLSGIDDP